MKIAEVLHINDLKLPEGVSVKTNVNYTLAVISAPEAVEAGPGAAAAAAAPAKDAKAAPAKDAKAPAKK